VRRAGRKLRPLRGRAGADQPARRDAHQRSRHPAPLSPLAANPQRQRGRAAGGARRRAAAGRRSAAVRPAGRQRRARSLLARLQLGIEALYRVETRLAIDACLIAGDTRDGIGPARAPREQLLLRESGGELGMALFVDDAALANLERHDPAARLDDRNFTDFCLAIEGVSHFVYVALAAARERAVSQLELELQAEVDKFVCCTLVAGGGAP